jgi:hypothetical protein
MPLHREPLLTAAWSTDRLTLLIPHLPSSHSRWQPHERDPPSALPKSVESRLPSAVDFILQAA